MLQLTAIGKTFPGVTALDDVSLRVAPGEIHALVGENGAGKSTLIKIITGICQPDEGEMLLDGAPLRCRSYRDSLARGIAIVNQEIQVIPESTIAENIMLDKMITVGRTGIIRWAAVNRVARRYLEMVGLPLSPNTATRTLSAAQKQLVQIAKALAADARVLLLDEPTSSLTEHEAGNLFGILRGLKARGVTILFVSHKVEEVFALCDTVSVLRDGRHVGTARIADLTAPGLIRMMIGRDVTQAHLGQLDVDRTREMLRVEHVVRRDKADDVSLAVYEGEILGLYGLVGAGRTELARIIMGEDRLDGGAIYVRGKPARIRSVGDALYRHRIGYVTENRKEEGLLLQSPVGTNITITVWPRLCRPLTRYISRARELAITRGMIQAMSIRTTGPNQKVEDLSGGNQQKVCISKWLAAECDILIVDEPTVGVDIGAKEQIHQLLWDLAKKQRKAVIVISSDMPEIIKLASRILVFRDHRIVGEVPDVDAPNQTYARVSAAIGQYLN
jgi:ribose transport system ATP-binding protein